MHVRRMFMMFEEGTKIDAAQWRERLDISFTSRMELKWFHERRRYYDRMIDPSPPKLPPPPPAYYIKAESKEARDMIFSVFRSVKRGTGHDH